MHGIRGHVRMRYGPGELRDADGDGSGRFTLRNFPAAPGLNYLDEVSGVPEGRGGVAAGAVLASRTRKYVVLYPHGTPYGAFKKAFRGRPDLPGVPRPLLAWVCGVTPGGVFRNGVSFLAAHPAREADLARDAADCGVHLYALTPVPAPPDPAEAAP